MGYEIAYAEAIGKKHILCLYGNQKKALSGMIAGNKNLRNRKYQSLEEAKKHIDEFVALVKG